MAVPSFRSGSGAARSLSALTGSSSAEAPDVSSPEPIDPLAALGARLDDHADVISDHADRLDDHDARLSKLEGAEPDADNDSADDGS